MRRQLSETASAMPAFIPKPPIGTHRWAASPARNTRRSRQVSATIAFGVQRLRSRTSYSNGSPMAANIASSGSQVAGSAPSGTFTWINQPSSPSIATRIARPATKRSIHPGARAASSVTRGARK